MKILFLGDVVAKTGRIAVLNRLADLKRSYKADFTVINGENAAHGKGITSAIYDELIAAGADVVTLGNHAFSKSAPGSSALVRLPWPPFSLLIRPL